MNKIHFTALDITVYSDTNKYRDDGFVSDLREHSMGVYKEIVGTLVGYDKSIQISSRDVGACLSFEIGGETTWVVCYKECSNKEWELLVRAHEETEVLHAIGRIAVLQSKLAEYGIFVDLECYNENYGVDEREFVANIGGLYALMIRGLDMYSFDIDDSTEVQFYSAREVFER